MTETLRIAYINCGFCTAKNHCSACGKELAQSLAQKPGIEAADVNIPEHALQITHDLDRDALEDMLDAMGLMAG